MTYPCLLNSNFSDEKTDFASPIMWNTDFFGRLNKHNKTINNHIKPQIRIEQNNKNQLQFIK